MEVDGWRATERDKRAHTRSTQLQTCVQRESNILASLNHAPPARSPTQTQTHRRHTDTPQTHHRHTTDTPQTHHRHTTDTPQTHRTRTLRPVPILFRRRQPFSVHRHLPPPLLTLDAAHCSLALASSRARAISSEGVPTVVVSPPAVVSAPLTARLLARALPLPCSLPPAPVFRPASHTHLTQCRACATYFTNDFSTTRPR